MNELLQQYKDVKDNIASLEKLKAELELQIMDEFDSEGIREKATPFGQFSIMGRKTYEYSKAVSELAEELKKKKKIEELDGTALLKTDSRHLRISPIKEASDAK